MVGFSLMMALRFGSGLIANIKTMGDSYVKYEERINASICAACRIIGVSVAGIVFMYALHALPI